MLPIAEPAASRLAACRPRFAPSSLYFSSSCFSCFSITVVLAGKIAGNARNGPPIAGPNSLAMTPAMAVINPPKTNRIAYSCHFVFSNTEVSLEPLFFGQVRLANSNRGSASNSGTRTAALELGG
jgi:hypothetical protein